MKCTQVLQGNMNKDPLLLLLLLCFYVTMYLLVPYIKGMKYYEGMQVPNVMYVIMYYFILEQVALDLVYRVTGFESRWDGDVFALYFDARGQLDIPREAKIDACHAGILDTTILRRKKNKVVQK